MRADFECLCIIVILFMFILQSQYFGCVHRYSFLHSSNRSNQYNQITFLPRQIMTQYNILLYMHSVYFLNMLFHFIIDGFAWTTNQMKMLKILWMIHSRFGYLIFTVPEYHLNIAVTSSTFKFHSIFFGFVRFSHIYISFSIKSHWILNNNWIWHILIFDENSSCVIW